MVAVLDSNVGAAEDVLRDTRYTGEEDEEGGPAVWDRTLVWAMSDNGGMVGWGSGAAVGSSASSNWPLRGGKTTLFEVHGQSGGALGQRASR